MGKKLNNKQANMLFDDVLEGDVQRFGNFKIGKYSVTIYRNATDTGTQRTRALNDRRKEAGVCVDCEAPLTKVVRCRVCLDKVNKRRAERLLKKPRKNSNSEAYY